MKTIIIKAVEFANFRTLANQLHIIFDYKVKSGNIEITADAFELSLIGF